MNYLAHALLAGPEGDWRLGGLLGDFVKGPLPPGRGPLPESVRLGVVLHRRIDSFADAHAAFLRSRGRVSEERRRYGGIMVDMFYDHFLARHWAEFSDEPLASYTARLYALLAERPALLPERLREILPLMRRDDWLASYRELASVSFALDRMGEKRLRPGNRLAGSGAELEAAYAGFERDFLEFFPDALDFAARFRAQAAGGQDLPE